MKLKRVSRIAAVAFGSLLAGAALAQSSAPGGPFANIATRYSDGPRVMMYWQLPLDGARAQPARYGLRLDSAPLRTGSLARLPLIDFRMQSQHTTLRLSGVPVARWSDSGEEWDSITNPRRAGFWAAVGLGLVAVSCATDNWPCKDDYKSSGGGTYTPPG